MQKQSYHDINCIQCGQQFPANQSAYNLFPLIKNAADYDFQPLLAVFDLKYYMTIAQINNLFSIDLMINQPQTIHLSLTHIKKWLDFILHKHMKYTFKKLIDEVHNHGMNQSTKISELIDFLEIKEQLKEVSVQEQFLQFLELLNGSDKKNNALRRFDLTIKSTIQDSNGHDLITNLECSTFQQGMVLSRVCPHCGKKLEGNAGMYQERIVGLIGPSRVGKSQYLRTLIHRLNKSEGYIHAKENKGTNYRKYMEDEYNHPDYLYATIKVGNMGINYIFLDIPGIHLEHPENQKTINRLAKSLFSRAHYYFYFIDARTRDFKHYETIHSTLTKLNVDMKDKTAVILTQSHYDRRLYQNENVFQEYLAEDSFIYNRFSIYEDRIFALCKQNIQYFEGNCNTFFRNYALFAVSSYTTLKNGRSSMVELPFLWLSALAKDIDIVELDRKDRIKTIYEEDKLFINS